MKTESDQCEGEALAVAVAELKALLGRVSVMVWDPDSRDFKAIESVSINGPAIQLTLEAWRGKRGA